MKVLRTSAKRCDLLLGALPVCLLMLLATTGCDSKPKFRVFQFAQDSGEYLSTIWTVRSSVHIDTAPTALRCEVKADLPGKGDAYGGIMFPAQKCEAWRLELAFTEPDGGLVAYVDAYNARKERVARWQTQWGDDLSPDRVVRTFIPHQSTPGFKTVTSEGKGPIDTIHVFLRLKPGKRSSFEIHKVELAK